MILSLQGSVHTLSNLHFNSESKKGSPGLDSEMCSQSGSYTLHGNVMAIPYVTSYGANRSITVSI